MSSKCLAGSLVLMLVALEGAPAVAQCADKVRDRTERRAGKVLVKIAGLPDATKLSKLERIAAELPDLESKARKATRLAKKLRSQRRAVEKLRTRTIVSSGCTDIVDDAELATAMTALDDAAARLEEVAEADEYSADDADFILTAVQSAIDRIRTQTECAELSFGRVGKFPSGSSEKTRGLTVRSARIFAGLVLRARNSEELEVDRIVVEGFDESGAPRVWSRGDDFDVERGTPREIVFDEALEIIRVRIRARTTETDDLLGRGGRIKVSGVPDCPDA